MKKVCALILTLTLLLSLTACGGKTEEAVSIDVNALYDSFDVTMPDMFYPDEDTMMNFLGISVEDCAQYKVAICAEGMRCDEVWLMEAKDETALKNLQELAETRIQAKLEETESYAPDQYVVVQKAVVLTKGNYLALLISPEVDALKTSVEAAFN